MYKYTQTLSHTKIYTVNAIQHKGTKLYDTNIKTSEKQYDMENTVTEECSDTQHNDTKHNDIMPLITKAPSKMIISIIVLGIKTLNITVKRWDSVLHQIMGI